MTKEEELEMAERHILLGEEHVSTQRRILMELRRDGHPTAQAEELLVTFEMTLTEHIQHRDLIRAELRQRL